MLGITMGDANGVGPEIVLQAYRKGELLWKCMVIGDYAILQACNEMLGFDVPIRKMADLHDFEPDYLNVYDLEILKKTDLTIGRISKETGNAALKYVECATRFALKSAIVAIVTLPMNKEATRLSTENFTGHTEYIASICGKTNYAMMLASDKLIATHVSTHVSQKQAIENVKADRIYDVIRLTHDATKELRPQARIAVAGLNPHAGENGIFGMEDIQEIKPAVIRAHNEGLDVYGPIPPDVVFYKAFNGHYDAVVCMYHDQGHIPMKLLDFEGGVNVTLGLQIVRTSVDHGTAFDIAYKGIASTKSFVNACSMASRLSKKELP